MITYEFMMSMIGNGERCVRVWLRVMRYGIIDEIFHLHHSSFEHVV